MSARPSAAMLRFPHAQRFAVFDIETTGLNAGFGRVLCAVVGSYDPRATRIFRADDYPDWKKGKRANDQEIVKEIISYLNSFDVLVGHNILRFDLPFLRSRALIHGLEENIPPKVKCIDPVLQARRYLRFPSNRLDMISELLDTTVKKTPTRAKDWICAYGNGDKGALDSIVKHCIHDVDVVAQVAARLRGLSPAIDALGSWR